MNKLPWVSVLDSLPPAEEDVLFWARFPHLEGTSSEYQPCFGYKESDDDTDIIWRDKTERTNDDEPITITTVTHWARITKP